MLAILAGTATIEGNEGADYTMRHNGTLPGTYCTKKQAEQKGWKGFKGNLRKVLPNATIGGNVFYNDKGKLPLKAGRIWYEADINYTGGTRNGHRILYSNDGLLFVTYDHYSTFCEIV